MNDAEINGPEADDQWYWDLRRKQAVSGADRGPDSDTMGPYPTKQAAENWKELAESRNAEWNDSDEEWDDWGDGAGKDGAGTDGADKGGD